VSVAVTIPFHESVTEEERRIIESKNVKWTAVAGCADLRWSVVEKRPAQRWLQLTNPSDDAVFLDLAVPDFERMSEMELKGRFFPSDGKYI
jgi:hypothetical protein